MSDPFVGEIRMFGGNFAPQGWALCYGQLMAISQNTALYSLLGTNYGGDGRSTFGLPDLRGRAPVAAGSGAGLSSYVLGQMIGTPIEQLLVSEMPTHVHNVTASTTTATATAPAGLQLASGYTGSGRSSDVANMYSSNTPTTMMALAAAGGTGGGAAHNNMMPYLAVSFIIALQGIFPSRS